MIVPPSWTFLGDLTIADILPFRGAAGPDPDPETGIVRDLSLPTRPGPWRAWRADGAYVLAHVDVADPSEEAPFVLVGRVASGGGSDTATNFAIGEPSVAFAHGTYGPSDSQLMMACVDYAYAGAIVLAYACDTDSGGGARGHITDYAGEYCGARLDYTWAWTDGATCSYTGTPYTWGYAVRGYPSTGGND